MKRGIALVTVATLLGTSCPFAYANAQSPATTVTNTSSPAQAASTVKIVKPGDTLLKISQSSGVPVAQIARYNGITNTNMIYVGQGIKIPRVWTVKSGDTLWKIAQATGSSVQSIAEANGITNAAQIQAGSVLVIPSASATYTVQPGDSLWKIAKATGVSTQTLIQMNHIANPDILTVGKALQVPTATGASATGTAGTGTSTTPSGGTTATGSDATGSSGSQSTTSTGSSSGSTSSSNPNAPRQDVAVVLSDGTKVKLPYTYENANGMEITFNAMSRNVLYVTVTDNDPLHSCVLDPKNWYVTTTSGYVENNPNYVDPNLVADVMNGQGHRIVKPGETVSGTIGFGAFGADNGLFTLHIAYYKGDSTGSELGYPQRDTVTFATGNQAANAVTVSTPRSDETVTVNAAMTTMTTSYADLIWIGTSPMALTGTPVYDITTLQGGDASTASVDPVTHRFTAKAPGTYRISATVDGISSTDSTSAVITVLGSPATIDMSSTTYQAHYDPSPFTLYGTVKDQNGSTLPYTAVTYSSDNPSVVSANGTVMSDQNGNFAIPVSLSALGTAHITINAGSASTVVTVNVGPAVGD